MNRGSPKGRPAHFLLICLFSAVTMLSFTLQASSSPSVTCSHPKVCELFQELAPSLEVELDSTLKNLRGDPHHAQLTFGQLKGLIRADILLTPSTHLQPWLKRIRKKRKENGSPTFTLQVFPKKEKSSLSAKEKRILSHFWLYPSQIKAQLKDIQHFLKNELGIKNMAFEKIKKEADSLETKLKRSVQNYKSSTTRPVILTHDALQLLLQNYHIETLSLSGSSHGEVFGPKEMKALTQLREEAGPLPLTWIIEDQIQTAQKIDTFIRDHDHILKINTSGFHDKNPSLFAPLKKLIEFFDNIQIKQGEKE